MKKKILLIISLLFIVGINVYSEEFKIGVPVSIYDKQVFPIIEQLVIQGGFTNSKD